MKLAQRLLWVLFYGLVLFLSLNRHSRSGRYNYHSEIWADKAGYMVYLPAAFCYRFEARNFPDAVDVRTGEGFRLDLVGNRVETKYPYGVALLQAPFWGVAQVLSPDKSGFSSAAHKAIDVAGATYFVLGLALLFATLRRCFSKAVAIGTLSLLVLGTNLWYYGVIETGMSHAYSFCAFALLLWLLGRAHIPDWGKRPGLGWEIASIAATLGLISILRPLNLAIALPLLLWPGGTSVPWARRLLGLLQWRTIVTVVVAVVVCWLPQVLYYKYARGGYFVYSYGHESLLYAFAHASPKSGLPPTMELFFTTPCCCWRCCRGHGCWRAARAGQAG